MASNSVLDRVRSIIAPFVHIVATYDSDPPAPIDGKTLPLRAGPNGGLLIEIIGAAAAVALGAVSQGDPTATPASKAWFVKVVNAAGSVADLAALLAGGLPSALGGNGGLKVEELNAPAAEDNTNAVIAVAAAPFAALTFANGNPTVCERYSNRGTLATELVKSSSGKVFSASCTNLNALGRYLQIHNTAAALTGGEAPQLSKLVPGNGAQLILGSEWFTAFGEGYSTGITFAFSTTENTYTAATAADQSTEIRWI